MTMGLDLVASRPGVSAERENKTSLRTQSKSNSGGHSCALLVGVSAFSASATPNWPINDG